MMAGSRVDGIDFPTVRLDAVTEFVIDQQDIFTCMGGAKPEDLHTWIDAFATVGSLGGQVSISSAIIEERPVTTNAVREATIGCRKTLTALRLKGTSSIQGEIKTHLGVLVNLLTKLESHLAELQTKRVCELWGSSVGC